MLEKGFLIFEIHFQIFEIHFLIFEIHFLIFSNIFKYLKLFSYIWKYFQILENEFQILENEFQIFENEFQILQNTDFCTHWLAIERRFNESEPTHTYHFLAKTGYWLCECHCWFLLHWHRRDVRHAKQARITKWNILAHSWTVVPWSKYIGYHLKVNYMHISCNVSKQRNQKVEIE